MLFQPRPSLSWICVSTHQYCMKLIIKKPHHGESRLIYSITMYSLDAVVCMVAVVLRGSAKEDSVVLRV